jgi:hypothetical protein
MSEPISTRSSPPSSIIVRIVTNHVHTIEALTTTSADSLDHATLHSSYENTISLTHILYSSENLVTAAVGEVWDKEPEGSDLVV